MYYVTTDNLSITISPGAWVLQVPTGKGRQQISSAFPAAIMVTSLTCANIDWSKIDKPELVLQRFPSRRSVVYGTKGVVSSSQPLATEAGLEILRQGGNAGTDIIAPIAIKSPSLAY